MAWKCAAIFAALVFWGSAGSVAAQDVTLTSRDGAVEISGTLLSFDGEFYRVETRFGELTVDGSGVRCDGPGCPNLSDFVAEVTFSGSPSMAEVLLPALVEGFAQRNGLESRRIPENGMRFRYELSAAGTGAIVARFAFRITNTDQGFADLLAGEADVVMALREIRADERQLAAQAGMGDMTGTKRSRVLALDAIVPVIAPENPVQRVSAAQLSRILAGEITNWAALGGPDAPIAVHLPSPGTGLAQAVEDRLLEPERLALASGVTRHARSGDLAKAVAADPFAIGLTSFAESADARVLMLSGGCGFVLDANRQTIKTEDYPLTSPMFLYLPARRLPKLAREFLRYTQSPAAQTVIRASGFVDQAPEEIGIDTQGLRIANAILTAGAEVPLRELQRMTATLKPMVRLTTSFRFEAGSTRPDAQSRANIAQLAQALEARIYDNRRLVFVGFSDGYGSAQSNRNIARARAVAVRNAVLEAAKTADLDELKIEVAAFGEALPMACDDSDWGRQVNRRVEVWIE